MVIHPNCRIELAVSKDKEFISEPYFTGKELVATDSYILAVVKVEGCEDDTPGYVSGAFLKRLRAGRWSAEQVCLNANGDLNGDHRKEGAIKVERPLADTEFPNWREAVPGERLEAKLALNPELLLRLSQAIGLEESVILHIPLDGDGKVLPYEKILVTPNDWKMNQGNYGVIMPCRMQEAAHADREADPEDVAKDEGELPVAPPEAGPAGEKEDDPEGGVDEPDGPESGEETEPEEEETGTPQGEEPEEWEQFAHAPEQEPDEDELGFGLGGVWQGLELPAVKKVRYESAYGSGYVQRTITKVYFKDGTAVTLAGAFSKEEAVLNAYYEKAKDSGMTVDDAAVFAGKERVEPLREN